MLPIIDYSLHIHSVRQRCVHVRFSTFMDFPQGQRFLGLISVPQILQGIETTVSEDFAQNLR